MAVMKRSILFFVASMFAFCLQAQSRDSDRLSGQILHAGTGESIPNVTVALYSMPDSMLVEGKTTDANGHFMFSGIQGNDFLLIPSCLGFESKYIRIDMQASSGEVQLGEIFLAESTSEIEEVRVAAAKPQVIYRDNKKILSVREFQEAGASSLAEVLENAPSVTLDSEGNVMLRGSTSYTLLIDGKPIPGAGANILRQIPPEMVESIEIMTNPSARYDPDGVSGIINLVLKKQTQAGANGMITAMAGLGDKYTGDAQLNYRKGKVNTYAGVSHTHYRTTVEGDILRRTFGEFDDTEIGNSLDQDTRLKTTMANAGLDYQLNERNSLSVSARLIPQKTSAGLESQIDRQLEDPTLSGRFLFDNTISVDGMSFMPMLSWDHAFPNEGQKLAVSAFAGGFTGDIEQRMQEEVLGTNDVRTGVYTSQVNLIDELDINDVRLKMDYEQQVSEAGKLEFGYQYRLYGENTLHRHEYYDDLVSDWMISAENSNELSLDRGIHSLYSTWSGSLGKFQYQAGLRGEYVDRSIKVPAEGISVHYDKVNLFPSGNISRKLSEKAQLQLSYSRRINRPGRGQMNPMEQFADNQFVVKGNPQLKPEYIDSWELGYQYQLASGFMSLEGYYRKVNDLMTGGLVPGEGGVMYQTFYNANTSHSAGTELMLNFQPKSWLRMIFSGNAYYYRLDDELLYEENEDDSFVWTSNLTGVFLPTKTTRATMTIVYNGPSITPQGSTSSAFMVNMGIRQEFMKKKAALSLSLRDAFSTFKFESTFRGEGYETTTLMYPEARVLTLTFTYNFNNYRQRAQEESMDLNLLR